MYDGSAHATPVQQQQQHQQQNVFMEGLFAQQHAKVAAMEESGHSQNSPTVTVLGSRSLHTEHPQPLHHSPLPTASAHNVDQNTVTDRIRMNFLWEKTSMNVWLDMSAPGEAFFMTFQQLAEKRTRIFDRAEVTIYLKKDKKTPDSEAYALSLDEEELQTDWETTLTWLEDNKRETPPHVFGWVQVGEG